MNHPRSPKGRSTSFPRRSTDTSTEFSMTTPP